MEGRNTSFIKKSELSLTSTQKKVGKNTTKVQKRYSDSISCNLHTKLFRVLDDEYQISEFEKDIKVIFASNPGSLSRCSEKGHSLVIDILHLPFVTRKDNSKCEDPTALARQLFSFISSLCKDDISSPGQKSALSTLLIKGTDTGYNPLTQLLSNDDIDIQLLQTYLATLKTALRKKIISKTDIQNLFRLAIKNTGNTALHLGAQSGNCEMLNLLVDFLKSFNDARMIQELLAIQNTSQKVTPACSKHLSSADAINDYLDQLRKRNLAAPAPRSRVLASSSESETSETDDNNMVVEFKPIKLAKSKSVATANGFGALAEEDDLDSEDTASDSEDNIPDLEDERENNSPLLNKKSQQKTQPTVAKKMTVEKKKNTPAPVKKAEANNVSVAVESTKPKPPRDCCSMITSTLSSFFTRQSTPQTTYSASDTQKKKKL